MVVLILRSGTFTLSCALRSLAHPPGWRRGALPASFGQLPRSRVHRCLGEAEDASLTVDKHLLHLRKLDLNLGGLLGRVIAEGDDSIAALLMLVGQLVQVSRKVIVLRRRALVLPGMR